MQHKKRAAAAHYRHWLLHGMMPIAICRWIVARRWQTCSAREHAGSRRVQAPAK